MVPDEILRKRDELAVVVCQVRWCDDQQLDLENSSGVSPGGDLNPFGWFVIGTTGGGNGVVVHADEPGVYFADHEWEAEKSADGVRQALILLAPSIAEFQRASVEIDARLNKIG